MFMRKLGKDTLKFWTSFMNKIVEHFTIFSEPTIIDELFFKSAFCSKKSKKNIDRNSIYRCRIKNGE